MFQFSTISIVLFLTAILNLLTFYASWQKRKTKGGYYFSFAMLATAFWVFSVALDYAAVPVPLKIFFAKLETLFYNPALFLIFVFFLIYVGFDRWLEKSWLRVLLIGIPTLNIFVTFTNDWHHLYWSHFSPSTVGKNILVFHHGPAFAWTAASGYVLVVIMLFVLIRTALQSPTGTRRQYLVLFFALLIPTLSNVFYLINIPGLEGLDWSSIFFSLSGLLLLWAFYGTRFLDLVPIARYSIVEKMGNPIIVLDNGDRIVDLNPAATKTFEITRRSIGGKVNTVFAEHLELLGQILSGSDQEKNFMLTFPDREKRYFDVDITLLRDYREHIFGKLFVFRDITEQHKSNLAQKERLEEIQALNESLKKTQDIVVEQASQLAVVEERKRLGRDLHDSVNQSIHSVMLSAETLQALLEIGQIEKAHYVAERIQVGGLQALKEVRLLLYEIISPLKDEKANFIDLMQERLNMVEKRVGIQANIEVVNREHLHCSRERIENLYWLAIEALNNALKHARATEVLIRVNCTEEHLIVEIKDNGIGFNVDDVKSGGLGMRSMYERARLLNGELTINSVPGEGTTVRFWATIEP